MLVPVRVPVPVLTLVRVRVRVAGAAQARVAALSPVPEVLVLNTGIWGCQSPGKKRSNMMCDKPGGRPGPYFVPG